MKVLGYDPQITVQRAWQLSSSVEQALSLDDLFVRSDIISVHVPLTPRPAVLSTRRASSSCARTA
jgi:D-3-phosphoglycerate dehydrogenase